MCVGRDSDAIHRKGPGGRNRAARFAAFISPSVQGRAGPDRLETADPNVDSLPAGGDVAKPALSPGPSSGRGCADQDHPTAHQRSMGLLFPPDTPDRRDDAWYAPAARRATGIGPHGSRVEGADGLRLSVSTRGTGNRRAIAHWQLGVPKGPRHRCVMATPRAESRSTLRQHSQELGRSSIVRYPIVE